MDVEPVLVLVWVHVAEDVLSALRVAIVQNVEQIVVALVNTYVIMVAVALVTVGVVIHVLADALLHASRSVEQHVQAVRGAVMVIVVVVMIIVLVLVKRIVKVGVFLVVNGNAALPAMMAVMVIAKIYAIQLVAEAALAPVRVHVAAI